MTMDAEQVREKVSPILEKYRHDRGMLVSILQDTQAALGYLAREALLEVSTGLEVPLSRVYSVATFFRAFSLKPRGRHLIDVCLGTACHVRGAVGILESIERETGIKTGERPERNHTCNGGICHLTWMTTILDCIPRIRQHPF